MDDARVAVNQALARAQRELVGDADEPARPLPEELASLADSRVGQLILRVLFDPSSEGIAQTLAWFYGSGLPDRTRPEPRDDELMDVGRLFLQVLQARIDEVGLDRVRADFARYMGETPGR